jgi:glucose/arabinose dehydrogenase
MVGALLIQPETLNKWFVIFFTLICLAISLFVLQARGLLLTSSHIKPINIHRAHVALVPIAKAEVEYGVTDLKISADGRFFVVGKEGKIRILLPDGTPLERPFLDLTAQTATDWEQGMLGLAFHPEYESNGYFYLSYSNADHENATLISRFQVSQAEPNLADKASELIILKIEQPTVIHQAGHITFGPDGYLYIGSGDGGALNDPDKQGQDGSVLRGKVLRIDVNHQDEGLNYAIPPDNPFVTDPNVRDEIWALGLRNPWSISFDRQTGDFYIADVGEGRWEEINFEPAGSPGGKNYGWSLMEGRSCFEPSENCQSSQLTLPIIKYFQPKNEARAVIGGFVYRGKQYPQLQGLYFLTDFITGELWSLHRNMQHNWVMTEWPVMQTNPSTFAQAPNGELYIADFSKGLIYHLQDQENPAPYSK